MAAPSTVTRTSPPAGIPLHDGFSTVVAISGDEDISFWEKAVTPPAMEGGDAIDITTMHNTVWRTMFPRGLITLEEVSITAGYDPYVYDQIIAIVNRNRSITVYFPDESTLDFFGFLKRFEPQEMAEGAHPEAAITIQPTNWDSANNVESAPVMTEVLGT